MGMNREQKEAAIVVYKERFENDETIVLVQYSGSTVAQMTDLRRNEEGVRVKVTKNTLARRAAQGTQFEAIADLFKGPVAMLSSEDVVAPAKVAKKFAKENENLIIMGGAMGTDVLDVAGVEHLAKMPSLDEIRGTLVGLVQAPATKVAGVLQAPAGQLARVIGAYAAKDA